MRALRRHILERVVFSFFVSLFFLTPICTAFVPFCTVTWTLGVVALAVSVFVASGWWTAGPTRRCGGAGAPDVSPLKTRPSRSI
jgi:hypothetical protein